MGEIEELEKLEQMAGARHWWTLVVILAATFMAILDNNIVNVAIPSIERELHASFAQVELVIAAYALAYAVVLVTGGRLGDLYGRKRLFQNGMLAFTLASLLCGIAPNANILIGARILQGLAASLMMPQVMSLIQVNFSSKERVIAFGFYGATIGLASIAGQIVGGFLISSNAFGLGWRNVFLVNVPIGVIAVLAALPLIHESSTDATRRLDLVGVGLLTVALFLLAYPLLEGRDAGWPVWVFICLILAVPMLAFFLLYEQRLTRAGGAPLLPLSLFKERSFDLGMVLAPLIPMILAGIQVRHAGAASGVLTTTMQVAGALGVAVIGIIFFTVLGKTVPVQPLLVAHAYGRAFVASLVAIIVLGVMTLLCIWLLSSPKWVKQDR